MNRQITTYNSDFLSFSFEVVETSPTSPAVFGLSQIDNLSVDINLRDNSTEGVEFPYVVYQTYFFAFKKPIKCTLHFKNDLFYLKSNLLGISVWESSKEELIDAFNFHFYSLYKNFVLEGDENLSNKAKILKHKILNLLSLVL